MKTFMTLLAFILISFSAGAKEAENYLKTESGAKIIAGRMNIEIRFYNSRTVRILKSVEEIEAENTSFSVVKTPEKTPLKYGANHNVFTVSSPDLSVSIDWISGCVSFLDKAKKPVVSEKSGTSSIVPATYPSGTTCRVGQTFALSGNEAVYGLGQHQQGGLNQRGRKIDLRQRNMEIAIPIAHSSKGYAIFWHNFSPTEYSDSDEGMTFNSVSGQQIDYFFMLGGNADGTIALIRSLTGQVPQLPLWSFGYWQCRERYTSQNQLLDVLNRYRGLQVPLDGIIQDWQYWSEDFSHWNSTAWGNPNYPNPQAMIDEIHRKNAHIAISVWPSFGPETDIYKELKSKNLLLDFETFPAEYGVRVYDAFSAEARNIYWKYLNDNLFRKGIDVWWLDATEPENYEFERSLNGKTAAGTFRDAANAFPLVSVGGIYDNQRQTTDHKRVVILTRSAFAGQQRYSTIVWSGDVASSWDVLRKQISAGLNLSLCGIPYWNTDIGGFAPNETYPEGLRDKAFAELYARWLQFAAFTPMMRSHGTHTPREIYQFGQHGDWAFDAIEKYIRLRYRLLPYIYSSSYEVSSGGGSMLRALFMDYPEDSAVSGIDDEFLFGRSLLAAPVTDSMYVFRYSGKAVENFNEVKTRKVYLPAGSEWYDFHSEMKYQGGQTIDYPAPIDIFPLFVKAGSIIPFGPDVQYAMEKPWDSLDLKVYAGNDAEFALYEDAGDGYDCERGQFSTIRILWNDRSRSLTIDGRTGNYAEMNPQKTFNISVIGLLSGKAEKTAQYSGKKISVKF
ncbi:MAG: DUF5110 domain-containing protein [Dysgonamonadaceae bacterium]|jgi:alpha-D-xyloside xylohydrolase|nr:DUF5110 domain-containing protein [Dysgonamonadaceae bacterium]